MPGERKLALAGLRQSAHAHPGVAYWPVPQGGQVSTAHDTHPTVLMYSRADGQGLAGAMGYILPPTHAPSARRVKLPSQHLHWSAVSAPSKSVPE
jgi:hypothetical protein